MKKIFLLSLLSVLCLSAFSQISGNSQEILAKIHIIRYADADDGNFDNLTHLGPIGWELKWWPFYTYIITDPYPWGDLIRCVGFGVNPCYVKLKDLLNIPYLRGIDTEKIDVTCQNIIDTSYEQAEKGLYKGSITKKLAFLNPETGGKEFYLLFLMDWEYDPENLRNGKAEITISKTDKLGL